MSQKKLENQNAPDPTPLTFCICLAPLALSLIRKMTKLPMRKAMPNMTVNAVGIATFNKKYIIGLDMESTNGINSTKVTTYFNGQPFHSPYNELDTCH
jgi:hypothetical protein